VIKGSQALAFVRQRHGLPGGDLDRIRRQQYFLSAAFDKVLSGGVLLNPFKLHNLLTAVGSSLMTDPGLNPISLARQLQELAGGNIKYATIPNDGAQLIYPDGVATSIVAVDSAAIPGFVNRLQGKPADPALAGARPAVPADVTLDVLNGTTISRLAGRNADALRAAGFHVDVVDSTEPTAATTIEYPNGGQSAAKAVAVQVPGAELAETGSVHKVTLVLGSNGVEAKALGPGERPTSGKPAPVGQPNCIN
jgi:hypothetical protein